jgi:RNA polymerase sigma-70 factor (ECF subfamily)
VGTENFTEVFLLHRRRLEQLAHRLVGDWDEAADIVADAFLAYIENGPLEADEAGAWLYVVTRNRALNVLRGRARAARRPLPRSEPVVEAEPTDERVVSLLARATDSLSPRDARVLEFRYRLGLDYAEIGAALGISATASRLLVHRASRRRATRRSPPRVRVVSHATLALCGAGPDPFAYKLSGVRRGRRRSAGARRPRCDSAAGCGGCESRKPSACQAAHGADARAVADTCSSRGGRCRAVRRCCVARWWAGIDLTTANPSADASRDCGPFRDGAWR